MELVGLSVVEDKNRQGIQINSRKVGIVILVKKDT